MTLPSNLREQLLNDWEAQVIAFRQAVAALADEALAVGVAGEPWTVGQILYHAAAGLSYPRDLHEIALTTREATATDMRLYDPPIDDQPSREELLALIDERAAVARAYLAALSEETFFAAVPVRMPSGRFVDVSVPAALQSSIDHQREHLSQVEEWLRRGRPIAGRLAD